MPTLELLDTIVTGLGDTLSEVKMKTSARLEDDISEVKTTKWLNNGSGDIIS